MFTREELEGSMVTTTQPAVAALFAALGSMGNALNSTLNAGAPVNFGRIPAIIRDTEFLGANRPNNTDPSDDAYVQSQDKSDPRALHNHVIRFGKGFTVYINAESARSKFAQRQNLQDVEDLILARRAAQEEASAMAGIGIRIFEPTITAIPPKAVTD